MKQLDIVGNFGKAWGRIVPVTLALAAGLALVGLSPAAAQAEPCKRMTLVFQGSVHGEIEDCGCKKRPLGGVARRAVLIEDIVEASETAILLDAGNVFGQADVNAIDQTRFLMKETARLNYSAFGVGPWDLNYGVDFLREVESKHGLEFVSANLQRDGKLMFAPYRIVERDGVRIGIISVVAPELLEKFDDPEGMGLTISPAAEALDRHLPELRDNSDMIVLLANFEREGTREFLQQYGPGKGIDFAIEGYRYAPRRQPLRVGDTYVLCANSRGKYLGQVDFCLSESGVDEVEYQVHDLELSLPEDKGISERVEAFKESFGIESESR